jgi:pimeloyl-ACP methyl ester carboxylesterase
VTLIGHSMGTIVLNEMLSSYPELRVTNIVYMAAACSVRDFLHSVIPYMHRNSSVRFFNLTLHPKADAREKNLAGFAPGGSLLEYLDNYLTAPRTELERTLGKWDNALRTYYIIPERLRDRVFIKGFADDDRAKAKPRKHGEFNDVDVSFWKEGFWTPTSSAGDRLLAGCVA